MSDGTIINENYTKLVEFGINKYKSCTEKCEQITGDIARIKEAIELQNTSSPEDAKEQIESLTADINSLYEQKAALDATEALLQTRAEELKQKL